VQIAPELPWIHAMRQQANNFVKAVKGEKTPLCGAEDALKDLEVTKAYLDLYLSAGGKL
jgi:predicted dehydrogenase